MPLPLPIMIPFMMWQSAAIAAGFGTYFQFAKRRVSAMSNEDFNKADPHQLVNSLYDDIVKQIPSSFAKVDSLTPVMLQSMNVMLDQAVKWLQGAITGNFFGTPNPINDGTDGDFTDTTPTLADLLDPSFSDVKSWTSTKLNLVHSNQMDFYTSKAQGFIHSVHDFNKKQKDKEFPDEQVPLDTIDVKDFQFIHSKYSSIHRTTIDNLNNELAKGNIRIAVLRLASLRANKIAQSKRPNRSPTQFRIDQNQIKDYTAMILELNKILGA